MDWLRLVLVCDGGPKWNEIKSNALSAVVIVVV